MAWLVCSFYHQESMKGKYEKILLFKSMISFKPLQKITLISSFAKQYGTPIKPYFYPSLSIRHFTL